MSLRVWLPLTGDLHNLGLSDITFSNLSTNNTTINNSGKIGLCYTNNSFTDGGLLSNTTIELGLQQSMFCWFKFTGLLNNSSLGGGLISLHRYSTNKGMGITIKYASSTTGYLSINTGTGSSRTYNQYCGTTLLQANTWYHGGYTYNNGTVKIYVNGICEYTGNIGTMAVPAEYLTVFCWSMSGSSGNTVHNNYKFKGSINDVRIYDHALSEKEVKEIAKGLVLWYPLNDMRVEATTNLVTTVDGLGNTCYNGATGKYSYGTTTDMYKTYGNFLGKNCTKVYMGTAGLSAYPYVYFDAFNTAGTAIHTLSFDYYPTNLGYIIPYSYNGLYNFSWTSGIKSGSNTNASEVTIPVELNTWNHITITMQKYDTTNMSRGNGYIRIGAGSHTSTTTNYWLFANVLVEAKDHATAYAGVGGTRTPTTVYDCSGFGNNGTIGGNLTIGNNGPRYKNYTSFNGSNFIAAGKGGKITDSITVSIWGYMDNWANYTGRLISCTESGGWTFYPTSSGKLIIYMGTGTSSNTYQTITSTRTLTSIVAGWHHFVLTYDGLVLKWYLDGILENSVTCYTTKTPIYYLANNGIFVGAEALGDTITPANEKFIGNLSDVRIYAIALSAEDIQELYRISQLVSGTTRTARDLI